MIRGVMIIWCDIYYEGIHRLWCVFICMVRGWRDSGGVVRPSRDQSGFRPFPLRSLNSIPEFVKMCLHIFFVKFLLPHARCFRFVSLGEKPAPLFFLARIDFVVVLGVTKDKLVLLYDCFIFLPNRAFRAPGARSAGNKSFCCSFTKSFC